MSATSATDERTLDERTLDERTLDERLLDTEPPGPTLIESIVGSADPFGPSVLGSPAEPDGRRTVPPLLEWIRRLRTAIGRCAAPTVRWLNAALVSAVLLSAFIGNEYRSQDYDPMYMRDIVERQMRYGGSFYVNGIHNKGPLEPLVYRAAALFTNWNSYWFAISGFILLASLFLGWCTARVLRVTSGQGALGFAVGAAVLIHLTVTGADYAGVLYSRNMTVCLMSAAFVLLIDHQTWVGRRRLPPAGAALLVGALLGLSVQTLTTTAL